MTQAATGPIQAAVETVRARIAAACRRAGRDSADVTLIAVSKGMPVQAVVNAWRAGIRDFGENRVQEGISKIEATKTAFTADAPRFHLVGHLQANKARAAVDHFAILHGVDSEHVLQRIAAVAGKSVAVMIEVNVAGEPTKHGAAPEEVARLVAFARSLPPIRVLGLMTVAPQVSDAEQVRGVFVTLRRLAHENGLKGLSMGMTGDFEVAIEEGATHVRIGRAIFGERSE